MKHFGFIKSELYELMKGTILYIQLLVDKVLTIELKNFIMFSSSYYDQEMSINDTRIFIYFPNKYQKKIMKFHKIQRT